MEEGHGSRYKFIQKGILQIKPVTVKRWKKENCHVCAGEVCKHVICTSVKLYFPKIFRCLTKQPWSKHTHYRLAHSYLPRCMLH